MISAMRMFPFAILLPVLFLLGCHQSSSGHSQEDQSDLPFKGALVSTHFSSLEELKSIVKIEYFSDGSPFARLTHSSDGGAVTSVLESGVTESHFIRAQKGGFRERASLGLKSPYSVMNRADLKRTLFLARKRFDIFGEGDVAFYNIAQQMVSNITTRDSMAIPLKDFSEKGYLNTFNHITAQALLTTLFSEELADFIADVHERDRLPALITGKFTKEQIEDLDNGPVDNYVDIINNEWGQELGKRLQKKYDINRSTKWTAEFLTQYLNDVQNYYSYTFQMGFEPFRPTDEVIKRYSSKIQVVMKGALKL